MDSTSYSKVKYYWALDKIIGMPVQSSMYPYLRRIRSVTKQTEKTAILVAEQTTKRTDCTDKTALTCSGAVSIILSQSMSSAVIELE